MEWPEKRTPIKRPGLRGSRGGVEWKAGKQGQQGGRREPGSAGGKASEREQGFGSHAV